MDLKRTAYYSSVEAPIGTLWIAATEEGICELDYASSEGEFVERLERRGLAARRDPERIEDAARELDEYFAGRRREFGLPLDVSGLSDFRREVLLALRSVPFGEVTTYGELAERAGRPGAARAVGGVMATNPIAIMLPCHRVVRRDGTPGEYALHSLGSEEGRRIKLMLLDLEQSSRSGLR
jgi:methylated-DNA-[protein]-cysteine S-methyltransferase